MCRPQLAEELGSFSYGFDFRVKKRIQERGYGMFLQS